MNQREHDVATAFRLALESVVKLRPDLIVVAGDLFHSVRPSNYALVEAFRRWSWVRDQLPGTPIVLAGGNHDLPKTADASCILRLFTEIPGVHIALEPTWVRLNGVAVRCIPETNRLAEIGEPDPSATYNVLLAHGETPAMAAKWGGELRPHTRLDPEQLGAWDYIALGHYHVAHQVGPKAWYAGSLEYTSSNPWDELREQQERGFPGKGWLLATLDDGGAHVEFQSVPTRGFVDLPAIDAAGLTSADVMARIAVQLPAQLAGTVIRQKVLNLAKDTAQGLDHERIRGWKAEALNFFFDLRRAAPAPVNGMGNGLRKRPSVAEAMADFFNRRELPPDVDRAALAGLAERTMAEAAAANEAQP